jgi:dipeptidyl aminopeptidase/acylaminoacyl peptidase
MSKRVVLVLLVFTMAAVSVASAFDVESWREIPTRQAPAQLFGTDDTVSWPSMVENPWYVTEWADPVEVRRGWIDFGKSDQPVAKLAVTQLWFDGPTEATLTLKCDEAARILIDGEEVVTMTAGDEETVTTVNRSRGRIQVQVEIQARAKHRARFRLSVESEGCVRLDEDSRRALTSFEDTRLLPSVSSLAINPDGTRLLMLTRTRRADGSRDTRLELRSLTTGRKTIVAHGPVSAPRWLLSDRYTYRERGVVVSRDIVGRSLKPQLGDVEHLGQYDLGSPVVYITDPGQDELGDPAHLTTLRPRLTDWSDRATVNVRHGVSPLAPTFGLTAAGDFHVTSFAVDRSSTPARVAMVRKVPVSKRPFFVHEIWLTDVEGGAPRLLTTVKTGFEIWPQNLTWSPDGTKIAYTGNRNDVGEGQPDHNWADTDVWVLDVASGETNNLTAEVDVAPQDRSGHALSWLNNSTIAFPATEGHGGAVVLLDTGSGHLTRVHHEIEGVLATVGAMTVAADGNVIAWIAETWSAAPRLMTYSVVDGTTKEIPLGQPANLELATVEPFVFNNSDGDQIDGWLYRPLHTSAEDLPLVVYFYGGAISTTGGLNGTHQWLAANGYAVYVLNPRGAHSYGQEFADHHINDWGIKAPSDVMEGVTALLAAHPELDADHIGCYGGSYGGFMTMSLLTQTDMFAAGVSMYGISNIASYWGEGIWGSTYGDMALAGSYPWNTPDLYADRSPLFHADKITTPLLLLHGAVDANVPPGESEQMFTALKMLGRDVELVRFADEDHGISGSWDNRVAHRTMMLEWFDRWLKNDSTDWDTRWAEESP